MTTTKHNGRNRGHDRKMITNLGDAVVTRDEDAAHSVNLLADDSEDNKSVDSDRTEDPRYPWNDQSKADTPRNSIEAKKKPPPPQESPTTKTLNILSQNMDGLQCKPCFGNQHDHGSPMSSTNTTPLPVHELPRNYNLDWEIHPIRIIPPSSNSPSSTERTQALGAVISRDAFPGTGQIQKNHCVVNRLHEDGLAMRCGLQKNDWFLCPMDMTSHPDWSKDCASSLEKAIQEYETRSMPKLAMFDEILEWCKESIPKYRPIRVLRKKKKNTTNKGATLSSSNTNATPARESKAKTKTLTKSDTGVDSHSSKIKSSNLPPYCTRCNYNNPSHWSKDSTYGKKRTKPKRPPQNHHAWCPENKEIDTERVEKRLARMKHCYRNLGCEACHMEYQTGKVISVKKKLNIASENSNNNVSQAKYTVHNEACRTYQRILQREERYKREQEEQRKEAEARKLEAAQKARARDEANKRRKKNEKLAQERQASKKAKKKNHKRRDVKVDERRSTGSSSDESDDDFNYEDESVYQPPTRKARLETITYPIKNKKVDVKKSVSTARKRNNKRKNRNMVADEEELGRFEATTFRKQTSKESEAKPTTSKEDNEHTKPVWVPLYDNPWGEEGYQTGDILLFGPQMGIGHHETHLLPSHRYKINPFGNDSTYRNTHCSPEEGLVLILLKRDPMGKMPWGFQVVRDEFGNACLVESVDPCSPASNASFLGVPARGASDASVNITPSSALNVNDMIVLINGKPVGGMTEVGMEVELKMAGPNLLLGVSRYKYAHQVAQRFAEMERRMLDFMDQATRDDRLMGWREIGCGNGVDQREATTRTVTTTLSSSQPERTEHKRAIACDLTEPSDKGEYSTSKEVDCHDDRNNSDNLATIATSHAKENESNLISTATESIPLEKNGDNISFSENSEDSAAHDDNPQMGCVCGAKHSSSYIKTFWIQCESCDTWYHVAENCIGFDEKRANCPEFVWNCAVCTPDIESAEEVAPSNENSDIIGISYREKVGEVCCQANNRRENKTRSESRENKSSYDNEGNHQSPFVPRTHSTGLGTGSITQSRIKDAQDSDRSNDISISCQSIAPAPADDSPNSENYSELQRNISGREAHRPSKNLPETPQQSELLSGPASESLLPERQRKKKKSSTPLAIRELKSYNRPGSGYWESFESRKISSNSDRCLRKRRLATNENEGKDKVSVQPKRDTMTSKAEDKPHTALKRHRNRSVREQIASECEYSPAILAGASKKANGKATVLQKSFKVGDLVFVENHAWAYVNNSGGIGKIQKQYISNNGDHVYDVKYPALGRTEKRISPEFISPYSFD